MDKKMDDVLRIPFAKQQFPECASEMLRIIDKVLKKWKSYVSSSRLFARDLQTSLDKYLFCLIEIKGSFATKLSPIQELQLMEMLCSWFDDRKSLAVPNSSSSTSSSGGGSGKDTPSAFELIFCGQESDKALHQARCDLLSKTISLSAQLRCLSLLGDTVAWMNRVCIVAPNSARSAASIAVSPDVKLVCSRLVENYLSSNTITPSSDDAHQLQQQQQQTRRQQFQRVISDLTTLAPGFLPYILASAMSNCDWFSDPPYSALQMYTDWICNNTKLLLKPYKEAVAAKLIGPNTPAFLKALSQAFGKLMWLCLIKNESETSSSTGTSNNNKSIYGRLQLGLMRLMESCPKSIGLPSSTSSSDTPCSMVTPRMVSDMFKMIHQTSLQQRDSSSTTNTMCYALFRAVQMGVTSKCYSGSKRELEQALNPYTNDYPFLEFLLAQNF